jgi:hypothetical protein
VQDIVAERPLLPASCQGAVDRLGDVAALAQVAQRRLQLFGENSDAGFGLQS